MNELPTLIEQRTRVLVQLGSILSAVGHDAEWPGYSCGLNQKEYEILLSTVESAPALNPWFTRQNILIQFRALSQMLNEQEIVHWIQQNQRYIQPTEKYNIALIMAGNIPLAGFHDLICTYVAGCNAIIKPSKDDAGLTKAIINVLQTLHPNTKNFKWVDNYKLSGYDAVIATGSNNSNRYFQYYFAHVPHLLRNNRTSVAIIDGTETPEELSLLADDVFIHFGLGCRNVGKIFIPEEYDINQIFEAFYPYHHVINHNKYANNYDYHRAVMLLEKIPFLDNGFIMLHQTEKLHSPLSVLYYQRYQNIIDVNNQINSVKSELQCITGHGNTPFGRCQYPGLNDYADNMDTMEFIGNIVVKKKVQEHID